MSINSVGDTWKLRFIEKLDTGDSTSYECEGGALDELIRHAKLTVESLERDAFKPDVQEDEPAV